MDVCHKIPLSDLPGLVPPALPWWAIPLVLWRTCQRVTYPPPPPSVPKTPGQTLLSRQCFKAGKGTCMRSGSNLPFVHLNRCIRPNSNRVTACVQAILSTQAPMQLHQRCASSITFGLCASIPTDSYPCSASMVSGSRRTSVSAALRSLLPNSTDSALYSTHHSTSCSTAAIAQTGHAYRGQPKRMVCPPHQTLARKHPPVTPSVSMTRLRVLSGIRVTCHIVPRTACKTAEVLQG